jgi:RRXRR protein
LRYLPVLSATGAQLMPCHAARARQLIRNGKAVKKHDRGIVYLVLTERETGATQPIAVGIDPGSKKEAYTIQSEQHTFLNVQTDAITWVKDAVETKRNMRRVRRYRKTPCRANRQNRARGGIPPSTKARWGWKVRIVRWLAHYYPLTKVVIEDIVATTKEGKRHWNKSFSPLQVGKEWCYAELGRIADVQAVPAHYSKPLRDQAGLTKNKNKMSDRWNTHCVDSFVLASYAVGGPSKPEQETILYLVPLQFHRRQLHRLQPAKGGIRAPYGGTMSLGIKRGSWVRHPKYGVVYVGGTSKGRISLHAMQTGKRLTQGAKVQDCQVLTTAAWRIRKAERNGA